MWVAMIILGVALWYLSRLVRFSTAMPASSRREVLSPLAPVESPAAAYVGEALEADLVLARLTGRLDVAAYQEAMAALAASSPSSLPSAPRHGR